MDETPAMAVPGAPEEHGTRLRNNALNLVGNVGLALGSAAPTASIALTLAAIVAASSYASPVAILVIGLPMLGIAVAFKRRCRPRRSRSVSQPTEARPRAHRRPPGPGTRAPGAPQSRRHRRRKRPA